MGNTVRYAGFNEMICALDEIVKDGGSMAFIPAGRSMRPTLRDKKDLVTISPANDLKKYDIVLYRRRSGKIVLHRIVKVLSKDSYMMCGDAQFTLEFPIYKDQIIGKASNFIRGKRNVDCNNPPIIYRLYVYLWDIRLVIDKFLYQLKKWLKVI